MPRRCIDALGKILNNVANEERNRMRLTLILGLMLCSGCGSFSRMFPAKSRQLPELPTTDQTATDQTATAQAPTAQTDAMSQALDIAVEAPSQRNAVTLAAAVSHKQAAPGQAIVLGVRCRTAKPWYIYAVDGPEDIGVPTRIELSLPDGISQTAAWSLPVAKKKASALGEVVTYADDMQFSIPLQIAGTVSPGKKELRCTIHYQACSDTTCLAPASKELTVPITVQ